MAEKVENEGRFKYYFVALAASIDALNYRSPIVSIDGPVMKN